MSCECWLLGETSACERRGSLEDVPFEGARVSRLPRQKVYPSQRPDSWGDQFRRPDECGTSMIQR